MGLYLVLRPCVVGNLHYAQVPAAAIVAADDVAAPLVASGDLASAVQSDEAAPVVKPVKAELPQPRRVDKSDK